MWLILQGSFVNLRCTVQFYHSRSDLCTPYWLGAGKQLLCCCLLLGNLFACIYGLCFLLSNEPAFPKDGTFPGWCPGLEATFLRSQCLDQCFYLITLIFFKNNFSSFLPSHCVCNFKFPCVVFSTKLHIFHTTLFRIIDININKHRNQPPCDRVFVMLS